MHSHDYLRQRTDGGNKNTTTDNSSSNNKKRNTSSSSAGSRRSGNKKKKSKRHRRSSWFRWRLLLIVCVVVIGALWFLHKNNDSSSSSSKLKQRLRSAAVSSSTTATRESATTWRWQRFIFPWGDSSSNRSVPTNNNKSQSSSPYAYVYLLANCDLDVEEEGSIIPKYRLFLYSIYVSISLLLRTYQSKNADIIIYYGMKYNSKYDDILPSELDVFQRMNEKWNKNNASNIIIKKLPKSVSRSFYSIQLNKFRVLGLTQYKRILYMDADVLPLTNLDFFFELSDSDVTTNTPPRFQDFMSYQTYLAPMNGGFFMITPKKGDLQHIQKIISRKENDVWHPTSIGWGHPVKKWVSTRMDGAGWTWWGANGDQGLLYYWFKHVKRRYSLILTQKGIVENYVPSSTDRTDVQLQNTVSLDQSQQDVIHHFTGEQKPWYVGCPTSEDDEEEEDDSGDDDNSPPHADKIRIWCSTLQSISNEFDLGIRLSNLKTELKRYTTADVRQTKGHPHTNLLEEIGGNKYKDQQPPSDGSSGSSSSSSSKDDW